MRSSDLGVFPVVEMAASNGIGADRPQSEACHGFRPPVACLTSRRPAVETPGYTACRQLNARPLDGGRKDVRMPSDDVTRSFGDPEALLATVARLFAAEGDLLAVDVLSVAKPRFEWHSHDNWDGGFDIFNLYLDVSLSLYSKIEKRRPELEQRIRDRLQSVLQSRTRDHIADVTIVVEVKGGSDWRPKARAWVADKSGQENSASGEPRIAAHPEIFQLPETQVLDDQVAVMMPFAAEFDDTYTAIRAACSQVGLNAIRADDIWEHTTFIQDIVNLIYSSRIVIVDFSGRNPNVLYETGIAHTVGRHVVPITRSLEDVPSDLRHHRALVYLANREGLESLQRGLELRLSTITGRSPKP